MNFRHDYRKGLEYVILFSLVTGVHCSIEETHYKSSENITPTVNPAYNATLTKRSRIHCAAACTEERECASFSFDKKSGLCRMSSGITENISKRVYYTSNDMRCPEDLGYSYDSQLNLCYRIEGNNLVSLQQGKQNCEQDGGHYVTILKQGTHTFLLQKLSELGFSVSHVFIDGNDSETEDVWKTADGSTMTWFAWLGSNPNQGITANCLELAGAAYEMSDFTCAAPDLGGYICQIDV